MALEGLSHFQKQNHMQLASSNCLVLAEDLGMKANLPSPCGLPVSRQDSKNTKIDQETNTVFSEAPGKMCPPDYIFYTYIFNLVLYSSTLTEKHLWYFQCELLRLCVWKPAWYIFFCETPEGPPWPGTRTSSVPQRPKLELGTSLRSLP